MRILRLRAIILNIGYEHKIGQWAGEPVHLYVSNPTVKVIVISMKEKGKNQINSHFFAGPFFFLSSRKMQKKKKKAS